MYNPTQRCWLRIINVTSALSRVDSALHREDVTTVVGFLASKRGRSVDEYKISVATTIVQLMPSQPLDYCCCRPDSYADITDETFTTRLVDHRSVAPVQRVALRRFQNHGTPFTWDKTPYQSATSLLHERMSLRPSYVLHMKRRRTLTPTTSPQFNSHRYSIQITGPILVYM